MVRTRNFGFKKKKDCTIRVAKTKALISCAVTAQLICGFVFASANCWFSHAVAHQCFKIFHVDRRGIILIYIAYCILTFLSRKSFVYFLFQNLQPLDRCYCVLYLTSHLFVKSRYVRFGRMVSFFTSNITL